jgi:hypothetical protein
LDFLAAIVGYRGLAGAEFLQVQEENEYKYRAQSKHLPDGKKYLCGPTNGFVTDFASMSFQTKETRWTNF